MGYIKWTIRNWIVYPRLGDGHRFPGFINVIFSTHKLGHWWWDFQFTYHLVTMGTYVTRFPWWLKLHLMETGRKSHRSQQTNNKNIQKPDVSPIFSSDRDFVKYSFWNFKLHSFKLLSSIFFRLSSEQPQPLRRRIWADPQWSVGKSGRFQRNAEKWQKPMGKPGTSWNYGW